MYVTQFLSPRNKDTPPDDPVFPPSAEASAHSHCSLLSHTGISDETCIPSADVLQRQPHLSKRLTFLPAVPDLQPVLPVSVLCIRMYRMHKYLSGICNLNDLSQIHDCDPVTDITDCTKPMTDEQTCQSQFVLQLTDQV